MGASSLSSRSSSLTARAISSGSIAGATVGSVVGAALIVVCALPFILKAIRKRRRRYNAFDEPAVAEMGMGPPGPLSPVSPSSPPVADASRRLPKDHFAPGVGPPQPTAGHPFKEHEANGSIYGQYGVDPYAAAGVAMPPLTLGQSVPLPISPVSPVAPAQSLPLSSEPGSGPADGQTGRQAPQFPPPWESAPETTAALPSSAFGTTVMTGEPEVIEGGISRTSTSFRRSESPSLSDAIRRFARRTSAALRRGSTRSTGGDSYNGPVRSPTIEMDEGLGPAISAPPVFPMIDDIPMGGASAEYYSGAPLSPPDEYSTRDMSPTYASTGQPFISMMAMHGSPVEGAFVPVVQSHESQSPEQLRTPFAPPPANVAPLTPGSIVVKAEDSSDDDVGTQLAATAPVDISSQEPSVKPPASPLHPAPGTVNPMDIMKPSNPAEKDWMVNAELEAIKNSPPPQVPQFTAVVRQPTEIYPGQNGYGNGFTREEPMQHDISDYSTPPPEAYSSGPSNQNTPDTRLTEPESNYTSSPSPQSSNNPTTPNTIQDDLSQDGASPRSYRCKECGRSFDQVHKLNHHKRYHERPHECPHCEKRFGTKTHLDRHINDKHMKTKKYHCTVATCAYSKQGGKSFPRKDNWRRHMTNKHQEIPDYEPPEAVDEPMGGT
ncbi:Serendipity locus protein H-1 [Pleurostoma richardsiae]|uniref:Serendipity locus protein H-1 n=1 Tax=Pleurostoma richardsiae TaxID=41990 RepID=A0AA38S9D7_9PEZI|nr:Serendipity locus protein H-1 [Pleurostoma richardsiae]